MDKRETKLALALENCVYIKNTSGERAFNVTHNPFDLYEDHTTTIQLSDRVTSVSFERGGNALAAGTVDGLVHICDAERGLRLRKLDCHNNVTTDVAWCHSQDMNYLVATGSMDGTIVFHDVRSRFSVVQRIKHHLRGVHRLLWNCNQSLTGAASDVYLASTGFNGDNGELSVWEIRDILVHGKVPQPYFTDSVSHFSQIQSLAWNPIHTSILTTGGSSENDSVIRMFDMQKLSKRTLGNNGVAERCHQDVIHSISCNSPITSMLWRRSAVER